MLLAGILEATGASNGADDEDLARYLGCTNIEFYACKPHLRELEEHGAITRFSKCQRPAYRVTNEVSKAVEQDTEFLPVAMTGLTADMLFSRIRKIFRDARSGYDDADRTLERLTGLLEANRGLEFSRRILASPLYTGSGIFLETERRMFLYICHRYVSHGDESVPIDTLTNLCDELEDENFIKRRIQNESLTINPIPIAPKVCIIPLVEKDKNVSSGKML